MPATADVEPQQQCGLGESDVPIARYTIDENGVGDYATAMSRLKIEGVTTIIYLGELVSAFPFTNAAESNAYRPEWFIPGFTTLVTSHTDGVNDVVWVPTIVLSTVRVA